MNLLELFKQSLLLQKKPASPITVKNYLSDVRHFILWLEKQFTTNFDPKLISSEILELYKNEHLTIFSGNSLERHLSSLRKFFVFLTEKNIIDKNPFTKSVTTKTTDLWKIKEFKDLLYRQNASAHTIKNYIKDIEGIRNWHAQTLGVDIKDAPNTIDFQLIQEYKTRLLYVAKLSPKTINRKLSAIRRYIEFTQNSYLPAGRQVDPQSIAIQNVSTKPEVVNRKQDVTNTAQSNQTAPAKKQNFFNFLNPSFLEDVIAHKIAQGIKLLQGKNNSKTNILSNIKKEFYAPDSLSIRSFPLHRKLYHHMRYTRPEWYKKYHNQSFAHYLNASLLIIYSAIIGLMLYQNLFEDKRPSFAAPTQPLKVYSFQGRLTDSSDEPITTSKLVRFILYTSSTASGSARLWEEVRIISPDSDGIFSVLLGSNSSGSNATTCNGSGAPSAPATGACGIHDNLFRDHSEVFLGISIEQDSELTPRQQIATVAYATNAHFLQGLPPITQSDAGITNVVLALDSSGDLTIGGSANPTFRATGGQFTLTGNTLTLKSNSSTNGNIQLIPDGIGKIDLQKPIINTGIVGNLSPGGVEINDKFGILATESAVAAFVVNNNTTGGDIFTASSSGTTQFTIANDGTTTIDGSVLPASTSNFDLGSSALKWNNIYVNTVNTTSTNTSGQAVFSYNPASTAFSESSVFINPTTADANDTLLGIGIGGTQKAGIDAEGDLVLGYSSATAPLVSNPFNVYNHGTSLVATIDTSGNASFSGTLKLSTSPTIQSTANQTLTLGGNTTGDISFAPGNSTNALYLKTGGNVGIGTATPTEKLHVAGNIQVSSTSDIIYSNNFNIFSSAANMALNYSAADLLFNSDLGEKVRVTRSGNVGIGTTTPTALLDVAGTASVSGALKLYGTPTIQSTANQTLTLGGDTTGDISFTPGGSSNALYLKTGGNVGIGTASPQELFNVNGETSLGAAQAGQANVNLHVFGDNAKAGSAETVTFFGSSDTAASNPLGVAIGHGGSGDYGFIQGTTIGLAAKNIILQKDGGNVGVGTTSPGGLGAGGNPVILHVADSGATTNDFALLNLSTADVTSGGTVGSLEFGTTGTASAEKRSAMIFSALSAASGTNVSGNLSFYTNNAGSITEKLQITSAGQLQAPITGSTGGILIGGDALLYRGNANELTLPSGDSLRMISGGVTIDSGVFDATYTAGLATFKTKVTGDTDSRFYIDAGGNMYWGAGVSGLDTNLYRSAADTLKTDDSFVAAVKGAIGQSTIQSNTIFKVAGATNTAGTGGSSLAIFDSTVTATANGDNINSIYALTTIAKGGFTSLNTYGLWIDAMAQSGTGTIANAYGINVAAQTIGTNNYGVKIDNASTQTLWVGAASDGTAAASGIAFGSSRDTNLYRSAADTLATDDSLQVGAFSTANTTAVCWDNSGASLLYDCNGAATDLAELYGTADSSIEAADIVVSNGEAQEIIDPSEGKHTTRAFIAKASKPYEDALIGIISTNPNQTYGEDGVFTPSDNPRPVSLAGRVPVKVSTENGPILAGDAITSSSIPGVGMRATKAGQIIGRALSSYNETGIGKVTVFVNTSWHDPDVYVTNTGDLSIQLLASEIESKYQVSDSLNQTITRMGAFAELVVGNIRAGVINAQQVTTNSLLLTTNNVTIAGQSIQEFILATVREAGFVPMNEVIVSPLASIDQINTNIISPLGSETIAVTGNIEVKNTQNETVAKIDTAGNATFSGTLNSQQLTTNKVSSEQLEVSSATISGTLAAENVETSTLTTTDATISGTLRAGRILADDIEGLNARIATLAANTITNYGTASAELVSSIPQAQLDLGFVDISTFSASFGTFREGLIALGPSTFSQITAIDSLSVGTNLAITTNSINLLGEDLQIQPLRQGGISFLAGLVRIDTNGNLTVGGNADFAKNVTVHGNLAANIISPLPNQDVTVSLENNGAASNFTIQGASNSAVLAIDSTGDLVSSGSGTFNKLKLSFAEPAYALDNTMSVATGSAGTAILKSTKKEITINNPLVTEKSLIYVTPVGNATNQVLYLLRQVAESDTVNGSFTVGISAPTLQDLQFNWIIIN